MNFVKLGERDPKLYRDENGNRTIKVGKEGTLYRGYVIKQITHNHPHRISGHSVTEGYSVSDGACAIMPGATWHQTVFDAMTAIDDLIESENVERGPTGEHSFWALSRFRRECEERAPELALLLQEVMDNKDVFYDLPDETQEKIAALLGRIDYNCDTRDTLVEGDKRSKMGDRVTGRFSILPMRAA